MAFAPTDADSDQLGQSPSLISLHCTLKESFGPKLSAEYTVEPDQTGWIPMLILVINVCKINAVLLIFYNATKMSKSLFMTNVLAKTTALCNLYLLMFLYLLEMSLSMK